MVMFFSIVIGAVSLIAFANVLRRTNDEHFNENATNVSQTIAETIDVERYVRVRDAVLAIYEQSENKPTSDEEGNPEWDEYIGQFSQIESNEDFLFIRDSIRKVQNANPVDCSYIAYIDTEREMFIYIVDAATEDACTPGTIDPVYEVNRKVLVDPFYGLPAYKTSTEAYGDLVTAGVPIVDDDGQVVGYALTDISLVEVQAQEKAIILNMVIILAVMIVIIIGIAIIIIHFTMIRPINKLTKAANMYAVKNDEHVKHAFSKLQIRTRDELEDLSHSMQNMENDINHQIEELYSVNRRLTASQNFAEEMSELANKDGLTGVKNITAYNAKVRQLEEELKTDKDIRFAVVMIDLNNLKKTNDTYGHECGDEAIKGLSRIACTVFKFSPVFRIGGDEFAVILQGHDYDRIDELYKELTEEMDRLASFPPESPEFRMSASTGYSKYIPGSGDTYAEVFRRADEEMYVRKRTMKKKKN